MPTLGRWLGSGSHRLVGWETDLSSQTAACQTGILHGNNDNIPAFRWWDRARKQIISASKPRDVAQVEQEHSDGDGLLAQDGASRANMFSGDAPNVMMTASAITDSSRFHAGEFYAYFLDPYNFSRTLLLTIWDVLLEIRQFRRARRNNVYPILDWKHRGHVYPLLRAFTNVFMREMSVYTLIGDMFAGAPAAYTTFVGYDEVAHHSGVDSEDVEGVLREIDRRIARLERASQHAPRPYRLVVLSDHGQSPGATFEQRYGVTLDQFVQELSTDKYQVLGDVGVHEDWKHVNVFLTEAVHHDHKAVQRPLGRALKGRTHEDHVILGPEGEELRRQQEDAGQARDFVSHIVVLGSGNLGLIYSSRLDERATMEEIEAVYPGLLDGLAQHEGIGFVMVHSQAQGAVVIGSRGRKYLVDGRVEGEDPLAVFGPRATQHLLRADGFSHAPDILVNSFYDPETREVAAFEGLIGSHGGLGGWQTQGFLLHPDEWETGQYEIVGAEALHQVLKGWLRKEQGTGVT
jgi:hypothetical protein